MSPNERAAYNAGFRATIHAARTAAITMETAPGSTDVRKQAAVAALYAFAESAEALALTWKPSPGAVVEPDPTTSTCIPPAFADPEERTAAIGSVYEGDVIG